MTVAQKINELRKERNLTYTELSKKSGVSQATFSNWNKGKVVPTKDALAKVAKVLKVKTKILEELL